jgi:hypothetical protein
MKFINANKLHRKSGGMGHPFFVREPGILPGHQPANTVVLGAIQPTQTLLAC